MKPEIEREWLTPEELVRLLQLILFDTDPGENGPHITVEMSGYRTHDGTTFPPEDGHWTSASVEMRAKVHVGENYASADTLIALLESIRRHGFEPYISGYQSDPITVAIGRNGFPGTGVRSQPRDDSPA